MAADGKTTLGDKVTDTIVTAIGRGMEGAAVKHKDRLAVLVKPMVESYLQTLPDGHPTRQLLASFESNTSVTDVLAWVIGFIPGVVMMVLALGDPWQEEGRQWANESNPNKLAGVQSQILAELHAKPRDLKIAGDLKRLGFGPGQAEILRLSQQRPLEDQAVLSAVARGILPATSLEPWLARLGYSAESIQVLKALYWRVPPAQDIIRMAVREAFSPAIAEKFGQYQDLPAKFVELAAQQGLSAEAAGWYWAAHWDLPSTSQGYEMLHRGVIDEDTLDMLLRAADVMPFWRDKLKAIAYQPLTRVDIRRMYQLGVLTEADVTKAYKDIGYSDENAARMLEFTKQYYGPEDEDPDFVDREWTKAEVLDGYRKKIITAAQARTALQEMAYNDTKIDFYLSREDYKATQERRQAYVDTWHSLYVNGIATADQTGSELEALGLSRAETDEYLALWYLQRIQSAQRPTKAELAKWLKSGIITAAQWSQEMALYGYSEQYIEWYRADIEASS